MALQIKGKFVENAAIDGDKLELKVGQAIKQKKADGTTVEVIKVVEESGQVVVKANDQEIAFKSQVDGLSTQVATQAQALIAAETAARIADVDAEEARALAAEGVLQSNIDDEETRALAAEAALSAAIASETSSRESADTALDARLDIIEGTGVGSVYKAEVDANQYADSIVLVEKTRAETAEAALSAAITAEETARIAGDAATLQSAKDYVDDVIGVSSTIVAAFTTLATQMADGDAATGVIDALGSVKTSLENEVSRATAAEAALQAEIDAEETRALAAEAALQSEINAVEGVVSAHDTRLDLLETQDITFAGQLASLQSEIDAEELARATADTALQAEVDAVESALAQELIDRQAGDASTLSLANSYTDTEVGAEEARAVAAEAAIQAEVDAVEAALATETAAREAEDSTFLKLDGSRSMTGDLLVETGHQIKIGSDIYNYNQQSASVTTIYNEDSTNSNVWNQLDLYASQISLGSSTETGRESESILNSKSLDLYERDSTTYEKSFRLQAGPELVKLEAQTGIKLHGGVSLFTFDPAFIPASDVAFVPTLPEHAVTKAYVDGLNKKDKFVLTQVDLDAGYIELDHEALPSSIVASVGRLMIHEGVGEDFTVSVVAGKTRMTFVGNLVNPSPEELGVGDVIYVKYMA